MGGRGVVEFISKRSGPRPEDVEARRLIERNRGTIERLADHLSSGAYSAARAPKAQPQPEGLIIHVLGGKRADDAPEPYVRISANDRVVLADAVTGRQLHFLGQIRRANGERRFVLATAANGFFGSFDPEIGAALAELDGSRLDRDYDEDHLAADVRTRLGVA